MIPKHKVIYTPEKEKRVLEYVQFIAVCAELIKVEYQNELVDLRFRNPVLNNHSKRIIESANQISKSLSSISYNTDREEFSYNTALEMYRLVKHFMAYPIEKVTELMDIIEKEKITKVS